MIPLIQSLIAFPRHKIAESFQIIWNRWHYKENLQEYLFKRPEQDPYGSSSSIHYYTIHLVDSIFLSILSLRSYYIKSNQL